MPRAPDLVRVTLERRGVRHGTYTIAPRPAGLPPDAGERWQLCLPIVWRGALAARLAPFRRELGATLRWFDALRAGARFSSGVAKRMAGSLGFVPAGTTVDAGDPREIEKVWVHATRGPRTACRDLWAKLAWIGHDESDASLRVRFSWGSEALREWHTKPSRFAHVDRFAEALFPECAILARTRELLATIARLAGTKVLLSERIVYNNCPGGGAVFHHDAEPTQRGVCFAQLAGQTAWLALPRRELAAEVAACMPGWTRRKADRALDEPDEKRLYRLMNATARFTARLHERGSLFVLEPGDVVLLPTVEGFDTCWHSVFGIGAAPSLAHSYGVFAREGGALPKR